MFSEELRRPQKVFSQQIKTKGERAGLSQRSSCLANGPVMCPEDEVELIFALTSAGLEACDSLPGTGIGAVKQFPLELIFTFSSTLALELLTESEIGGGRGQFRRK
jgi:hypothetical protein